MPAQTGLRGAIWMRHVRVAAQRASQDGPVRGPRLGERKEQELSERKACQGVCKEPGYPRGSSRKEGHPCPSLRGPSMRRALSACQVSPLAWKAAWRGMGVHHEAGGEGGSQGGGAGV